MEVKPVKTSCCKSFLLPKGRCFDCVDYQRTGNIQQNDDKFDSTSEDFIDPDEEII